MKPVFAVNILPNFLGPVLHPNVPLFMHLPYPPQYNLGIRRTEHSISTSLSTAIFTDAINLFNKKYANNSNIGIEISFTGASLNVHVHNLTITPCSHK